MAGNEAPTDTAAGGHLRRLCYFSAGFARQQRLRRILTLAGHQLVAGRASGTDAVVVWGRSPYARRGEAVAARRGLPLVRVEDALLRSVAPGRAGGPPLGLIIDPAGVYFDASAPSRLEQILARAPLDAPDLLARADEGMARIAALDLSKYNQHDLALPAPTPGYVLVVDQVRGDASIRYGSADDSTFAAMLGAARADHPGARIVIKTHPETARGWRPGHFGPGDCDAHTVLLTAAVSPRALLTGARAVYTVTSQLGFEAILAGLRPQVFGQPFYAGWGLSDDRQPVARRGRMLSAAQLFAGAMILAPVWYDPCRDRLCDFETALDQLDAEVRAWREDCQGYVATGMRLWKRQPLQGFFGREKRLTFCEPPAAAAARAQRTGQPLLIWAGREPLEFTATAPRILRVEDGFLRSRGLGAALVPPLSLVADDLGIYYDPTRESRLERLIRAPLPPGGAARAGRLIAQLCAAGVSKYNLGGGLPDLPPGRRILVPGQVADDASVRLGTTGVGSNLALLQAARAANPGAVIIYKPHPDVEAGLRPGALGPEAGGLADVIARAADPVALIDACDEVWTMTSLLGFEALLRGKPVTCLGSPFYAGWGLTRDPGPQPARRAAKPGETPVTLLQLAHAALIAYPRYIDPLTRLPCPPEVALERLANGAVVHRSALNRLLAKVQGALASHAWLWR